MNSSIHLRERAIAAVTMEFSQMTDIQLDEWARGILGLPDRPENDKPFIGWLMPQSSPKTQTKGRLRTSQAMVEAIKKHEAWRANAYICPAGVWTIGYGHTATAKRGMSISKAEGERLFKKDLQVFENAIHRLVKVSLNQNQFDALVSFAYNCGAPALSQSTLLRVLNQGNYQEAANQFLRWTRGGGKVLPGLVKRRQAEKELFES